MPQMHLIYPDNSAPIDVEQAEDGLWISAYALHDATYYEVKPEGFCLGDVCVPAGDAVKDTGEINLKVFAELTGRSLIVDTDEHALSLGAPSASRGEDLSSLKAPDFALPDLAGNVHRLSDYRGKKILLAAYASW